MAIAHPASSQAGPQPEPNKKPKSRAESELESGMELEAALPVSAPALTSDAGARAVEENPRAEMVIAGVDESQVATESSASHLLGISAEDIHTVDAKFEKLLATVHENRPGDDLEIIRTAWAFCLLQHEGQKRASGEPYIIHPLEVGQVLAELKMDSTAIAAGLLHDAVEDTDVTSAEIAKRFGDQVAHIVEGVTKLEKIKFANREDHQAENIRKMLLAMVTDVRVVIIKLADRLHNMRTLEHLKPEKQQKIARETLDIYAPLAHRLGMGKLRGELEDLAFRYTDPIAYQQIAQEVDALRGANESFLESIVAQIKALLAESGKQVRVEARIKRLYSVHQKLVAQKIPVDQVYDLLAVRIICQTKDDCWLILGLMQSRWPAVPGRIKDFISMPR